MSSRETDIRAAVESARPKLSRLPTGYADQAIASGRSVEQVKVDLIDQIGAEDARAMGRKSMLKLHGKTEADLSPKKTAAQREAEELAALPKSIAEAKGDVRAFAKAEMRRQVAAQSGNKPTSNSSISMEKELRKIGMEPVSR